MMPDPQGFPIWHTRSEALATIQKVVEKSQGEFPRRMDEMTEMEGRIAQIACERSGDLVFIRELLDFTRDYQGEVDAWVRKHKVAYWSPADIFLRLGEEQGELAKELNHEFGPKKKKASEKPSSVTEEVGDMLFTLACLCNKLGITFDDAFKMAMDKCHGRDKDRFEKSFHLRRLCDPTRPDGNHAWQV